MQAVLDYYSQHTPLTDPGQHAALFDNLPHDLPGLHQVVQNLLIHVWKVRKYHPDWLKGRTHEYEARPVEKMLTLALAHDARPLTSERPKEKKLIEDCRHHAVLLCAMLRHQGIPARVRCGFATYLEKSHYQDHWVTEYWDGSRWVLEDPDLVKHDFPREEFFVGGAAWQAVRNGTLSADQFGYAPDMRGIFAVRHDLMRDLACLNGFEGLSGDGWGMFSKDEPAVTDEDRALLDRAAELTLSVDSRFSEMREFYESQPLLRVPPLVGMYNYINDSWREEPWLGIA